MWQLSLGWYGDRLDPDYRPPTRDHVQSLLTDAGLTEAFWQLAALSDKDVEKVSAQLKLSGRIERDGWIEQARALMEPAKA